MQAVGKIPGMNAMALFHDQWMAVWKPSDFMNKASIVSAIVLTYVGTGEPLHRNIQASAVSSKTSEGELEQPTSDLSEPTGVKPTTTSSFTCVNDPLFREIVLEEFDSGAPLVCRVVYASKKGISVL
jgi:hypothetical protein